MYRYDSKLIIHKSQLHFFPAQGKNYSVCTENRETEPSDNNKMFDEITPGHHLIILATNLERAQYLTDLIFAAVCCLSAEVPDHSRIIPIPLDETDYKGKEEYEKINNHGPISVQYGGIVEAILLALHSSFQRKHQYALFKYLLSHHLFTPPYGLLDPSGWDSTRYVYRSSEHHVICAYSIIAAYSVIEELSLEIKASIANPSKINGKWNQKLLSGLLKRLRKAKIDTNELLHWTLRDTPTRIERQKVPAGVMKPEWSSGKVRDTMVRLEDAISQASWLRSKVSSHKLRDFAASLSYQDVHNVQYLARRLLLETLGFWDYVEE